MAVLRMITVGTPEAARLAEAVTYGEALHEARDAIARAIEFLPSDDVMAGHLINAGVIAYFRCFMTRGKHRGLDAFISRTPELDRIHHDMRVFRNQTVAHVDSGLSRTLMWLGVDESDGALKVRGPVGMTIHLHMPAHEAQRLLLLIEGSMGLLDEVKEQMEATVIAGYTEASLAELWERPDSAVEPPDSVLEWNPHRPRLSSFVPMSYVVS